VTAKITSSFAAAAPARCALASSKPPASKTENINAANIAQMGD
jgi:hypothetical protein